MNTMNLITDKQHFVQTAESFFNIMFAKALEENCGEIRSSSQWSGDNGSDISQSTYQVLLTLLIELCQQGNNVYFGVNPRVGRRSLKGKCSLADSISRRGRLWPGGSQKEAGIRHQGRSI